MSNDGVERRKPQVTDRALRYRAHQSPPPGPKQCELCSSRRFLVIDHRDGNETNDAPRNLRWLCKSCNTREGLRMARAGQGRRTKQFNPEAYNLAQYIDAVLEHRRGARDKGGAIIHGTPKERRREFARQIAEIKRQRYGSAGSSAAPDWVVNPDDAAEAARRFEEFHGYPPEEIFELIEQRREHQHLAVLGELIELEISPAINDGRIVLQNFDGASLCSSPAGTQIYVRGGNQQVDLSKFGLDANRPHDLEVLGLLKRAVYHTTKLHLVEGGTADYEHTFGEDNGEMPAVLYDTGNFELTFAGGSYYVEPEGIVN